MLNVAFRCLDIDRLSPFRTLKISGEDDRKPRRVTTHDLLLAVNQKLLTRFKPYKFIGLIQLNTGLRLSDPVYARVEDCVFDHPILHFWIRRNELSNRKNKSSIRVVLLVGVSLLEFRSHLFRHALIDRMKACHDIPTRLVERIPGHSSGWSEFNNYRTLRVLPCRK